MAGPTGGLSWWHGDGGEGAKRNLALIGVLLALFVIGAATRWDLYSNPDWVWANMLSILKLASVVGVVTVGMTFVIIGGGIDLSVGAIVALAGVWCTTVATQSFGAGGMIFTAIIVGVAVGLVNGTLIAYGRLVPFIATLAMLVAARGLAAEISQKQTQISQNSTINGIASTDLLGIPLLVYILAAVVAAGWVLLNRTTFGGARSPSAATRRPPDWPASTCGCTPCCCTRCPACAAASPPSCSPRKPPRPRRRWRTSTSWTRSPP